MHTTTAACLLYVVVVVVVVVGRGKARRLSPAACSARATGSAAWVGGRVQGAVERERRSGGDSRLACPPARGDRGKAAAPRAGAARRCCGEARACVIFEKEGRGGGRLTKRGEGGDGAHGRRRRTSMAHARRRRRAQRRRDTKGGRTNERTNENERCGVVARDKDSVCTL